MRKLHLFFLPAVFVLAAATLLAQSAPATTVEATGKAPGNVANCREQALTDALREAVRKGAGVNVTEQVKVTDFVLDYDRVFAASFGYVRNYTVLDARLGADDIYRVTVRAEVGAGDPSLRDMLALLQLVHLKQSPRIALTIIERIEGVPVGSEWTRAWFEEAARALKLQIVDRRTMLHQSQRLAGKDDFHGDARQAALRRAALAQDAEFEIEATVNAHYAGQERLHGLEVHVFTVGIDLRAVKTDSGDVVASVALPSTRIDSLLPTVQDAGREAVHKALTGGAQRTGDDDTPMGASRLFARIFAAWAAELDLGTIMRLEVARLPDAAHDALIRHLEQTEKVTALWPREFDPRGLTILDAESRLDVTGLKREVLAALGASYEFTGGTRHYLQFAPKSSENPGTAAAQTDSLVPTPPKTGVKTGMPGWAWALIGAGCIGALTGAFLLGRRR